MDVIDVLVLGGLSYVHKAVALGQCRGAYHDSTQTTTISLSWADDAARHDSLNLDDRLSGDDGAVLGTGTMPITIQIKHRRHLRHLRFRSSASSAALFICVICGLAQGDGARAAQSLDGLQ
jgi:hypothetical protein